MSAITHALREVKFRVPIQILNLAFKDKHTNWRSAPLSLDELIMDGVVRPRVLLDANLVGGSTVMVNLAGLQPEVVDNMSVIYRVPPDRLGNREIMSVLHVGMMPMANYAGMTSGSFSQFTNMGNNTPASVGARIADSYSNMPITNNTSVELVGANTVLIRNQYSVAGIYQLKCVVGNESNLSNISHRSWPNFARLVELAVKSFVYNTLLVRIDEAYLVGGAELGSIKNYIETLSDAEEMYQTELKEVWGVTSFCNDTVAYEQFIKTQICPNL